MMVPFSVGELSVFLMGTLYWRSLELCEEQFMKSQKCLYSQQEDCRKRDPQKWEHCHTHVTCEVTHKSSLSLLWKLESISNLQKNIGSSIANTCSPPTQMQ